MRSTTFERLSRLVLFVFGGLFFGMPLVAQTWSNGYGYRRSITIDHTKVPNTDQTNFPVLISGTYSYLATVSNGGDVTNTNGYDVIFTSDAAGTTVLPCEREAYNGFTGTVAFWVKIPTLSHSADTVIYMFYGNGAVTTDQTNKTSVWDSNFAAVWHLGDSAVNTTVSDSTSNVNNGVAAANTSTKAIAGEIGQALSFGGTDKVTTTLTRSTAFTWEAWLKPQNYSGTESIITIDGSNYVLMDLYSTTGSFTTIDGLSSASLGVSLPTTNVWYHLVLVRSGNSSSTGYSAYLNGVLKGQAASGTLNSGNTMTLGYRPDTSTQGWHGNLDEIRISNVARSGDWIATEYNNQNSPSTFYSIGAADTTGSGGTASPSISSLSPSSGPASTLVTINGTNFGDTQGSSTLAFNGANTLPSAWTASGIVAPVPNGATTGNVVVTVNGVASNGSSFAVTTGPGISGMSPRSGPVGTAVRIEGVNLGTSGTVTLNGTAATTTSWSSNLILALVPSGATSGTFAVTVGGQTVYSPPFSISALPPGWLDVDIGATGLTGNANFANGAFTVNAAGTTLNTSSDILHFVYQPLSGDGSIVARVVSSTGSSPQAGVMIRETLDPGSKEAIALYTPNTSTLYYRATTGTQVSYQQDGSLPSGTHPYWMKLTRSGNTITGYDSMDGINWNRIGSSFVTVTMATNVYIGLIFSGGSTTSLGTAVFDSLSVSSSTAPAPQITSLSATTGPIGSQITISGSGFGSYEAGSLVYLNGALVPTTAWSDTAITVTIPSGASTGPLVVSVAPGMNDSNPVTFTITTQPLPPQWEDIEIGSGGAAGGATFANGTFSVGGSTQYLNSNSDKTHFVYQSLSGDGSIVARVANLAGTGPQAGVMIRESLSSGSTYAYVYYAPNTTTMLYRATTGGSSSYQNTSLVASATPYWVKLTRVGNSFTAYVSLNGLSWLQVGTSQTITMATNVYIGLSAGDSSLNLAAGVFDNVSVNSSASPAPVISGMSATTASVGSQIALNGSGFGNTQGNSVVYLNGTPATINSWSANWITFTIPTGATSGKVVVSVAPSMNDSNPVVLQVTTQPLPTPWLDADIGLPGKIGAAGTVAYSGGTFTVTSTGQGLGGSTSDGLHFVYQPLTGDGTIIAHVSSMSGGGLAGVELRETLDPAAIHALSSWSPNLGELYYRSTTGGSTGSQASGYITGTPPYWVKLTRSGNSFNGYISLDGVTWSAMGSAVSITMAQTAYAGLWVSAGSTSVTAVIDNVSISTGTPYPTPAVSSVSPTYGGPGFSVTLSGSNLGASQAAVNGNVYFNGIAASSVTSWSSTQIVATVPSTATSGPVTVIANDIGSNRTVSFTVYDPIITSISPPTAPVGGSITISGSGFTTGGQVKFNGTAANSVTSWSDTSITAGVPTGATSGPLTVTVQGVTSPGAAFTVGQPVSIASILPTSGPAGSTVTINGSGFGSVQSNSSVNFNGVPATTFTSWSDSQIQVIVPASAATGSIYVTVASLTTQGPSFTLTSSLTLLDSLSNSTTYQSVQQGGMWRPLQVQGSGCSTCTSRGNISYTYDSAGNVSSQTDELGHTTTYTYDSNGNVLTVTVPLTSTTSATTTYTYNSFGEVLTATDPMGFVTTNTYDANGNLLSVTTPAPNGTTAASVTQFAYDTKGELTTITDPLNHQTTIAYYPTGLIHTITDAQSNVTTYAYDSQGNRTSVTDALSHQTTFTYDAMNRLTKITYPDTTTTQFAYDIRGRRTSVTDQNGKVTSYAYDDADRLTSVTDAANNVTQYAYDSESNLLSIEDANLHTTSFTFDAFGRVSKTTFPSSAFENYYYDAAGNLTSKTDRKNQTINYAYDYANRLAQKSYPDSTAVNYTYDNDSRLTQVTDPTGTYQFTFDNMGRLTGTTTNYAFLTARNFTTSYAHDKASNQTGFTDPESGSTTYVYDTLNRLQTLTPPSAFTATGNFGFSYDALSRRTQMTRPNGVATNYAFDNLSRLTSILHQLAGSTIDGATYTVDNAGNRTARTDQRTAVTTNYGYDAIYQLLSATQSGSTTESYTYDPVGNRTSSLGVASYTTNSSNELTATSNASYGYDNNGNAVTKSDSTGITTYAWDFENRLTTVTLPGSGGTVSFKYDPFGRRIYKSSSSGTSVFAYDGDNLIEETNSSGAAVARYSQGLNIDEPLAMLRSSATSFYNADGLGSVTSLANASGTLAQTYTFDSFGKQTASSGSLTNPFQYTARESDPETGLYYYRARYYDQSTGRFLSEDPNDQGSLYDNPNLYEYVENNPANWIDPLGLYTLDKNQKIPPLPPAPEIDKLLKCIESKTGLNLVVTSTSENTPFHPPGTPHRRGVAVDLKYDPNNADKTLCAAADCGAGFGLDEKKHPSSPKVAPHIHLQIPAGKKGGHGDLPKNTCSGSGCKP